MRIYYETFLYEIPNCNLILIIMHPALKNFITKFHNIFMKYDSCFANTLSSSDKYLRTKESTET